MPEETLNLNLEGLKKFCENVSLYLKKGDIICLSGDLGSGKTTFSRYLINSIYKNQNKEPPNIIKSPSFPILLTYELSNFEIYHYDLYRVSKNTELIHLNIFEELNNSITLVEWPGTILDSLQNYNYFSIYFDILDENTRILKHNLIFS
ncbi:MAG: tRNA (adenosine(37)-N6)-threonylcarbamoyltransferase complex ATPase subunit type 1 TsaE [Proteobacteria bacterium]|nr:tRNA (adenosine(37)-N6)-threonylcarbamoyltransferase complex ATPase subunit type 1 TsaE [Pseudomonadota bacterium]MDA1181836.1 tRNA (adenosine(37)-N6)-threonylcarbamoyltransferase complex ATPase subunit type 1 TsaE [Pseudomonadota bacterium]